MYKLLGEGQAEGRSKLVLVKSQQHNVLYEVNKSER